MPLEGTKTPSSALVMAASCKIEIRYAPGGDENRKTGRASEPISFIEIRYAPGGDENSSCVIEAKFV